MKSVGIADEAEAGDGGRNTNRYVGRIETRPRTFSLIDMQKIKQYAKEIASSPLQLCGRNEDNNLTALWGWRGIACSVSSCHGFGLLHQQLMVLSQRPHLLVMTNSWTWGPREQLAGMEHHLGTRSVTLQLPMCDSDHHSLRSPLPVGAK